MTNGTTIGDMLLHMLNNSPLSDVQRAKIEDTKGGTYEPKNPTETMVDIADGLSAGRYDELITLYKLLPKASSEDGIEVRMENGKVIPLSRYMNLCDNAFLRGNTQPIVKELIGSAAPSKDSYSKMSEQEYRDSAFGGLNYTDGLVSGIAGHAFRYVKDDLYREEILEVDKVYTLEEWQELMNGLHPCLMASYFYTSDIVLEFFAYLEDEYIIFNPGGGKVNIDFSDMCSHFS